LYQGINLKCIICKARGYCGKSCRILQKINKKFKCSDLLESIPKIDMDFFGSNVSFFVGRWGYPNVKVSPLITDIPKDVEHLFGYNLLEIIKIRINLLSPSIAANVNKRTTVIEKLQELAMSKEGVDTEVEFYKKPKLSLSFVDNLPPIGPYGELKRISYDNPKIPKIVDKVADDYSFEGVLRIYKKFDEIYASRLFSAGVLGRKKKLVPTRWSITSVDDMIGKYLIKKVREYRILEKPLMFETSYLGNEFRIYFLPSTWAFELIETYNKCVWNPTNKPMTVSDYEIKERKTYAKNTGGAYYAARLAVLEKLDGMKRQAKVIVRRIVNEEYSVPLGVWVIREAVRDALRKRPKKLDDVEKIGTISSQKLLDDFIK
jgi:hypothetical protein